MNNNESPPDLASVLRTLASLAPSMQHLIGQQPVHEQAQPSSFSSQVPHQAAPNFGHQADQQSWPEGSTTPPYEPPPAHAFASQYSQQPSQHSWNQTTEYNPQSLPTSHQPKNVVDPSTIIEWSAGLRCVMKVVAKNENIVAEIRRMIKVQHEHEEQWWNGRKALIEKLAARKEGKKKLDEVLKAVGGMVGDGHSDDSPEALARELETFDMKVYKAQMQMVREMNSRLRNLGIPFFGTRTDLVRPAGKEAPPPPTNGVAGPKDEKGIINEIDLVKLQRKMLAMLEDLSSE